MTRKKRNESIWFELDLRSQPRNWAEFIHEFIGPQRAGSDRSEEHSDDVIGVAKALRSISEGSFDSRRDKSRTSRFLVRGCVVVQSPTISVLSSRTRIVPLLLCSARDY